MSVVWPVKALKWVRGSNILGKFGVELLPFHIARFSMQIIQANAELTKGTPSGLRASWNELKNVTGERPLLVAFLNSLP